MKYKNLICSAAFLIAVANSATSAAFSTNVGDSVGHSVQALSEAGIASAKLGAGVISMPLLAIGVIGAVSDSAGSALLDFAEGEFPVGDEAVMKIPEPFDALTAANDHQSQED